MLPSYLPQGIIGQAHKLSCLVALSSTVQKSSVNLTWNFTSNDNRVTVIPTTITTDDSIGIIYTTVIQFAYLMEGDEGNYTCILTVEGNSAESIFYFEVIRKFDLLANPILKFFRLINVYRANHLQLKWYTCMHMQTANTKHMWHQTTCIHVCKVQHTC